MKKLYMDIIEAAINLNRTEVINLVKKLANDLKREGNLKDSNYITSIIGNTSTISINTNKDLLVIKKEPVPDKLVWKDYDLLDIIVKFLGDHEKIKKIGVSKILIVGRPGTGKTSFVKDIAKLLNLNLYSINASNLTSHKLGETQKNIEKLLIDINSNYVNSLFVIDEFDSLIGSRTKDINDEYQRMIGTFNIILDSLPMSTILIAISNRIESIDKATLRRFNVKIEMNEINLEIFKKELFSRAQKNDINFDEELLNKILIYKKDEIDFSLIEKLLTESIIYEYSLEKTLIKILNLESIELLKNIGLTLREIENVTTKSKSSIQRDLKKG